MITHVRVLQKKKLKNILTTVSFVSAALLLRFCQLGTIPRGLSLSEVKLGLFMSSYVGAWILSPLWVRLLFSITGVISMCLTYLVIKKIGFPQKVSLLASIMIIFTPWHIQESRIFSEGMVVYTLLLIILYLMPLDSINLRKRSNVLLLVIAAIVFVFSMAIIHKSFSEEVNAYRTIASKHFSVSAPKFLTNKLIESARYRTSLLFEGVDIGYYFFNGHPRERWGFEESQKLFISFLPLILIGIFVIEAEKRMLLIAYSAFTLSLFVVLEERGSGAFFPLLFPFSIFASIGLLFLLKNNKIILLILGGFFLYELSVFLYGYYRNYSESTFSPRLAFYESIVPYLQKEAKAGDTVVISDRLQNSEHYFRFYTKNTLTQQYQFRNFDVRNEIRSNTIFVDAKPDESNPESPYYANNGALMNQINILFRVNDSQRNREIFIIKFK